MKTNKVESVVSFRVSKKDKAILEQLIKEARTNKSEFVRRAIKSLLTIKNTEK